MNISPLRIEPSLILAAHPKKVVQKYADKGLRISGRKFDEQRKMELRTFTDILKNYSLVKCGNTIVLVWIRLEIAEKRLDGKGGYFIPTVTLPRMEKKLYSQQLEIANTCIEMIEKHIESWEIIDLNQLVIDSDKCWCLYADIKILNDDGNMYACLWKGLMECFKQTSIPIIKDNIVVHKGKPLTFQSVNIQKCVIVNNHILTDPDKREEDNCDYYTYKGYVNGNCVWNFGVLT